MNFRIDLIHFFIIFSRNEHQVFAFIYVSFNAWDSQVSSYAPFYFSFTVPLKNEITHFIYNPFKTNFISRLRVTVVLNALGVSQFSRYEGRTFSRQVRIQLFTFSCIFKYFYPCSVEF